VSRAIAKQILDEKKGLATGQPEIDVADSPHFFRSGVVDEYGPSLQPAIYRPQTLSVRQSMSVSCARAQISIGS